jgi:HlyD family secretion protein
VAIGKKGAVVRQLRTLFDLGTIRELTDGQLLERFATGDGEGAELAFAALVERHGPMVLRVCRAALAEAHDAEDAFQATFLVLVKKARGLWVRDSLGPWLHQVAYRTASCVRMASARRQRHERGAAESRKEAYVTLHDDLARVLHEEIERLPERFRIPLVLCDLEGRSHEQAARHLGWPIGTVKSRQARGRERLRDRLRRRGVSPTPTVLGAALRPDGASVLVSPALAERTMQGALHFVAARTFVPGTASSLARGVLNSMYLAQWSKVGSVLLCLGVTVPGLGLLAQKGATFLPAVAAAANGQAPPAADVPAMTVKSGKLSVTVMEKGSLEASQNYDGYSMVEGQTSIIMIKPEGTQVKRGEIVCQLDSASLRDQLTNQRITVKSAEASYQNAKIAREVAELAVTEYVEGIYKADLKSLTDAVTAADSAIQKADARLARTRTARKHVQDALTKKGAEKTPADIIAELDIEDRLEAAELTLLRESQLRDQAKAKQDLLQKITVQRTVRQLKVEVEQKYSAELAKQATWHFEMSKEKKLERQILACEIRAPADGTIVYANDPSRTVGRPPQIEEGVTVRERQKIFTLVDLGGPMQVNTKVHESQVDKLSKGMKAKIRVNYLADEVFDGQVIEVFPLPDATNFRSSDIKVYTTKVRLDRRLPLLRPGMTAEVEIHVAERDNVLSVPVEAVLQYDGKDHVAVKKSDGAFDWREVTLGMSNERIVEVTEGIKPGEQVAIKPIDLLTEQQKRKLRSSPTPPAARRDPPQ